MKHYTIKHPSFAIHGINIYFNTQFLIPHQQPIANSYYTSVSYNETDV